MLIVGGCVVKKWRNYIWIPQFIFVLFCRKVWTSHRDETWIIDIIWIHRNFLADIGLSMSEDSEINKDIHIGCFSWICIKCMITILYQPMSNCTLCKVLYRWDSPLTRVRCSALWILYTLGILWLIRLVARHKIPFRYFPDINLAIEYHVDIWQVPLQLSYGDTRYMMTSSNGNTFRVTGHLCGESPVTGEFPTQRPVTRSLDVFFHLRLNKRLSK